MAEYKILSYIQVKCQKCAHSSKMSSERYDFYAGPLTVLSVMESAKDFICSKCRRKVVEIEGPRGEILFDAHNINPCWNCGSSIPIARLKLMPSTCLCLVCQDSREQPPKVSPYPSVPKGEETCPKCDSQTTIRQNGETLEYFIGCTSFPKCRHTSSIN